MIYGKISRLVARALKDRIAAAEQDYYERTRQCEEAKFETISNAISKCEEDKLAIADEIVASIIK